MKVLCHNCQSVIEVVERIGFNLACPSCGEWLHSCVQCRFWTRSRCMETSAERVGDPEGRNFCEWFQGRDAASPDEGEKAGAKEAAEELWRKLTKK